MTVLSAAIASDWNPSAAVVFVRTPIVALSPAAANA
jgi:hypothetical protein